MVRLRQRRPQDGYMGEDSAFDSVLSFRSDILCEWDTEHCAARVAVALYDDVHHRRRKSMEFAKGWIELARLWSNQQHDVQRRWPTDTAQLLGSIER